MACIWEGKMLRSSKRDAQLGAGKIVGASCYNRLEHALEAEREGADYVAFGAFFASATKPGAVTASMDLLRHGRATLHVPIVAIGGITSDTAVELIQAGAAAVAVSNGLFGAPNIRYDCRKLCRII